MVTKPGGGESSSEQTRDDLAPEESGSAPMRGRDGLPAPFPIVPGEPKKAPHFTPRNVPCLRACRYYFTATAHLDVGNPADGLPEEYKSRAQYHYCMRIPGVELEISADEPVLSCNAWDPAPRDEMRALDERRRRYLDLHPDHDPALAAADEEEAYDDIEREWSDGPADDRA